MVDPSNQDPYLRNYIASVSTRVTVLLQELGVNFSTVKNRDETWLRAGETLGEYRPPDGIDSASQHHH